MNETPIFMKKCLFALRANKSLAWAVYHSAGEAFGYPVTDDEIKTICDRPKTPKFDEFRLYKTVDRWLARWFNPVFMGYANEMKDADLLRIWITINRQDTGKTAFKGSTAANRKFKADNFILKARELDKRHDWHTVK